MTTTSSFRNAYTQNKQTSLLQITVILVQSRRNEVAMTYVITENIVSIAQEFEVLMDPSGMKDCEIAKSTESDSNYQCMDAM